MALPHAQLLDVISVRPLGAALHDADRTDAPATAELLNLVEDRGRQIEKIG